MTLCIIPQSVLKLLLHMVCVISSVVCLLLFTCLSYFDLCAYFPQEMSPTLSSNMAWRGAKGQFLICVSSSKRGRVKGQVGDSRYFSVDHFAGQILVRILPLMLAMVTQ